MLNDFNDDSGSDFKFNFSFALNIVAWLLCIGAAVVSFMAKGK